MSKRDSKDPSPKEQFGRAGAAGSTSNASDTGGNTTVGSCEAHGAKKSSFISINGDAGRHSDGGQPTRENGDGNTPVTGEKHNSKKSSRGGEYSGKSTQSMGKGDPDRVSKRGGEAGNKPANEREKHDSPKSSRGGTYKQ